MNNKKVLYIGISCFFAFFISVICVSYAFYSNSVDAHTNKCNLGDITSCLTAASKLESNLTNDGSLEDVNDHTAIKNLYLKACELGDDETCYSKALEYQKAHRVSFVQLNDARQLLRHSCDRLNAKSCGALGSLIFAGRGGERNEKKGMNLMIKACDLGDGDTCYSIGMTYEVFYKDETQALIHLRKGCSYEESKSCILLGDFYSHDEPLMAKSFYEKACEFKNGYGCYALSKLHLYSENFEHNVKSGLDALFKSCSLNFGQACAEIGHMYHHGYGYKHIPVNDAKAIEYYTKACELSEGEACALLGVFYEEGITVDKSVDTANQMYKKGCELRSYLSCGYYADNLRKGTGAKQDLQKALTLSQRGCSGQDANSCKILGLMYLQGEGIKMNAKQAFAYFKKACSLGEREICVSLPDEH